MLSMVAWGDRAENAVGEDEVLSECLKKHIKQLLQCFSFLSALLAWTSVVAVGGSKLSAAFFVLVDKVIVKSIDLFVVSCRNSCAQLLYVMSRCEEKYSVERSPTLGWVPIR